MAVDVQNGPVTEAQNGPEAQIDVKESDIQNMEKHVIFVEKNQNEVLDIPSIKEPSQNTIQQKNNVLAQQEQANEKSVQRI